MEKRTKYIVENIDWDVDDYEELDDLPTQLTVLVPNDEEDPEEYISDYLSDEYGYCHNGFTYYKK